MLINLYNTNSAKNVVNKALEKITEYHFTDFIYDTDKNNIIIKNVQFNYANDIKLFNNINYATLEIEDITYKCFVENVEFLQGLVNLYLHIDILSTYWDSIKNLRCIVETNENSFNTYINNNARVTESRLDIDTLKFPNGFDNDYTFILNCIGKVV